MARGMTPRQPARSGKQEGIRHSTSTRNAASNLRGAKAARKTAPKAASAKTHSDARAKIASGSAKAAAKASKPKRSGYNPIAPARVAAILEHLNQLYPEVKCALEHASAWELLVATILSAQSTDANVNRVTPGLFKKYPTVQAFAALTPEQLEPDIRSTGFFRNKSKSVVGAAKMVVKDFGGHIPDEMDKLLLLPGVARKTANVVLGSWFGQAIGIVVDTHVHRISRRWEFTENNDPQKIEQDLIKIIPQDRWILFSHQVIHHGRNLCIARKPKCAECSIELLCHAEDKTWTTVDIHKGAKA